MNRIIQLDVRDEFISGAGQVIGAAGSHDDVELELSFSPMWAGTAKKIVWFDALGENTVVTALGTDLLLPGRTEVYRVPVPPEAKAVEGDMRLTIRGVNVENGTETRAVVAATACFRVLPAIWDPLAEESTDVSAGQADQLRAEIEKIKADVVGAGQAADALDQTLAAAAQANQSATAAGNRASAAQSSAQEATDSARTAFDSAQTAMEYSGNPPVIRDGTWHTWNAGAKTYEDTGSTARGERGVQGETGPQGPRGAKGETGAQGPRGPAGPQGDIGPTGPQGPAGPAGAQGQRGPAGADGRSFTVKGLYPSRLALETAHPLGEAGDAWAVGTADNNRVYLWDRDRTAWTDVGPLQGPVGPEGPAGPQGPQGPQGVQGPEGPQGPAAEGEFLPLSGGTLTGGLSVGGDLSANGNLTVNGGSAGAWIDVGGVNIYHDTDYSLWIQDRGSSVRLRGVFTPTDGEDAANKTYVDEKVAKACGGPYYATCSTAAGTAAKTVSCEGFTLKTGAAVIVKFTYYNTATSPTLNVNGTGAKYIKKYGTTGGIAYMWYSGEMVQFVYDGANWVMTKGMTATTTYYGLTKLNDSTDSYSAIEAATPSAVRQVNLTANEALALVKEHTHDARDILVNVETAKSLGFPKPINLVRNGSFEELEHGWELVSANVTHPKWCEAPDGYYVLDITDTWSGAGVVKQTLSQPLDSTHVYYFSMEANTYDGVSSATVDLIAGDSLFTLTEGSELQDSWTRLSVRVSGIQGDSIRINYVDYNSAYIDSIMLIDLTEAFGAGKEPDKTWCDANLTFDNTKCPSVDDALEKLAGRTDTGAALVYGGDGEAGKFDRLSTVPTATNPLRYNGVFRATKVFGIYFSDSADLAETYAVEGAWEWGDLIAIGADGLLRRNEIPENRHVLGFASQWPGVVLGGVEGVPIALAGRVPVRAEGVICAGDFLSAGTEPGTVRRADLDTVPRGSIVAMALEDKPASSVGPVLALVQRM